MKTGEFIWLVVMFVIILLCDHEDTRQLRVLGSQVQELKEELQNVKIETTRLTEQAA